MRGRERERGGMGGGVRLGEREAGKEMKESREERGKIGKEGERGR